MQKSFCGAGDGRRAGGPERVLKREASIGVIGEQHVENVLGLFGAQHGPALLPCDRAGSPSGEQPPPGPSRGVPRITAEEFAAEAAAWFADARHPRFGTPYAATAYGPMLELIALLRDYGFRVFVVTGGGVEFVRAIGEEAFGVAPDDVVGPAVRLSFEHRDGRSVLVRQAEFLGSPNEGAPKPISIQEHIGRRPSVAVGKSAGDREMLEYAQDGDGPSLCLVLDHDDAVREYAYAGASLTDPSTEPILTTAARRGWSVVSMADDWTRVF